MHKIYLEKRCIIICNPDDPTLTDPNAIHFSIGRKEDIGEMIRLFEMSPSFSASTSHQLTSAPHILW